jgi:hypothetical protein
LDSTDDDLDNAVDTTRDQITFFQDLLEPLKMHMIADTKNIFVPRCIGLLSRQPWLMSLKDWLVRLLQSQRDDPISFERYRISILLI